MEEGGTDLDRYSGLVNEIRRLRDSQREIKISKIHISQNSVSHDLAVFARSSQRSACWLWSNPLVDSPDVTVL